VCWWYIALHFLYGTVAALVGLVALVAGVSFDRQAFGGLILALAVFIFVHAWLTGSIVVHPWGISAWAGLSRHRLAWADIARFRVNVDLNAYWSSKQRVIVVALRHGDDVTLTGFYSVAPPDLWDRAERQTFVDRTAAALNDRLAHGAAASE
jgi:hypothetical protein